MTLDKAGQMAGAFWTGEVGYRAGRSPPLAAFANGDVAVRHDSRGELRGFLLVEADTTVARPLDCQPISPLVAQTLLFAGKGVQATEPGLKVARAYWGADVELRFDDKDTEAVSFAQTFVDPATRQPLLHGYQIHAEGIQFHLNSNALSAFVAKTQAELVGNEKDRRWYAAQYTRYLMESGARARGLNGYDARRGADLIVAAAGDSDLRSDLNRLLRFWSTERLADIFDGARSRLLTQHPLLTPRRVAKAAAALAGEPFRQLIRSAIERVQQPEAMAGYLRSCILHSVTVRLKQSIAHVGQGDDRRLFAYSRLPIQFDGKGDDIITICETGSYGDGTVRTAADNWSAALEHWFGGFLADCPNAQEDLLIESFWKASDRHPQWRLGDARDMRSLAGIGAAISPEGREVRLPDSLLRILFDMETVEGEQFPLYDLAADLRTVRTRSEIQRGRAVSGWEIATAAVADAKTGAAPTLARLLTAYAALSEVGNESLSAEARLAEQAFRLAAPLCSDGCRACVHQPSDLMSDSQVEVSVSRRLLKSYLG